MRRQEILEKCEVEHIDIPIVDDPMDTGSSEGPVFDFSLLSRSLQQKSKPSEREKIEAEFSQKISAMIAEIGRTAPNLKALDQYEAVLEKEREASKEWEAARDEQNRLTGEYNKVRQTRYASSFIVREIQVIHLSYAWPLMVLYFVLLTLLFFFHE